MFENIPPELKLAAPGIAGSAVAMFFLRRPLFVLVGMFVGGCLLSYLGTEWTAKALGMDEARGLVGFLLGTFGMAVLAKLHDTIDVVRPEDLWRAVRQFIRKRLGLEAGE